MIEFYNSFQLTVNHVELKKELDFKHQQVQ